MDVFWNDPLWYGTVSVITRSYYRKGSAALRPKPWGLIIPINFMYLNCLIHTVCMNLFCLKTSKLQHAIITIYYILYIFIHAIVGTNVLKLSLLVKMSRRTQLGRTNICLLT